VDGQAPPCPCHTQPPPAHTARGWRDDDGPAPLLSERHADGPATRWHGQSRLPHWVDHAYRYRRADGRWTYVAEPYEIDETAVNDLAYLSSNGYEVSVTASRARHDSARSLSIEITASDAVENPGGR
jgi:hypothetical protein